MRTIVPDKPIEIRGAEGKLRGVIQNRTLIKEIRGSVHLLRKPPAIAIDARMYDKWRRHFDSIEIRDTETGRVYRISAKQFESWRWELERGYGKQYAVALSRWAVQKPNDPQLVLEV
ncbi:hypothetical protein GBSOP10_111143 [Armatimonadetes bacterium GBS]|jgi:hypothetical protein|nr:hypothetical protein HRbin14_01202 [bacterium HR14]CUU11345.1 hypothetical protein GBSOP10_111143 [Armatimonadetes bacterium GBS]CUU37328.1 hypothetical protein GXSOP10_1323 [Armatimonadetes bacterium GXS]